MTDETMPSERVERGARALHRIEESWNDNDWEYLPVNVRVLFREQAAAVIAALAEQPVPAVGWREAIDAGLRAFCANTPDFSMSSAMRQSAADFILGQSLPAAPAPSADREGVA